jgi:hypothetical protein
MLINKPNQINRLFLIENRILIPDVNGDILQDKALELDFWIDDSFHKEYIDRDIKLATTDYYTIDMSIEKYFSKDFRGKEDLENKSITKIAENTYRKSIKFTYSFSKMKELESLHQPKWVDLLNKSLKNKEDWAFYYPWKCSYSGNTVCILLREGFCYYKFLVDEVNIYQNASLHSNPNSNNELKFELYRSGMLTNLEHFKKNSFENSSFDNHTEDVNNRINRWENFCRENEIDPNGKVGLNAMKLLAKTMGKKIHQ